VPFVNLPEARSGRWGEELTAEKMIECRWLLYRMRHSSQTQANICCVGFTSGWLTIRRVIAWHIPKYDLTLSGNRTSLGLSARINLVT
jgi:hypothetical protein